MWWSAICLHVKLCCKHHQIQQVSHIRRYWDKAWCGIGGFSFLLPHMWVQHPYKILKMCLIALHSGAFWINNVDLEDYLFLLLHYYDNLLRIILDVSDVFLIVVYYLNWYSWDLKGMWQNVCCHIFVWNVFQSKCSLECYFDQIQTRCFSQTVNCV